MGAQFLRINKKFMKKVIKLTDYLETNPYRFIVSDREIQLFELLEIFDSYEPANKQRYKGLGEMTASQLEETCLQPGKRNLVRLTIDDLKRDLAEFDILHGKKQKHVEERKAFMSKFKISIDDIDS